MLEKTMKEAPVTSAGSEDMKEKFCVNILNIPKSSDHVLCNLIPRSCSDTNVVF